MSVQIVLESNALEGLHAVQIGVHYGWQGIERLDQVEGGRPNWPKIANATEQTPHPSRLPRSQRALQKNHISCHKALGEFRCPGPRIRVIGELSNLQTTRDP